MEVTTQGPIEAIGQALAADATVVEAITGAVFGAVSTAADSPATRYIPVTIDGVNYLILAKLAP